MPSFTMKLTGGRMARQEEMRRAVQDVMGTSIKRAALSLQAGVQKTSPVRTGTLRRSWAISEPAWIGSQRYGAQVGTTLVYARYQNERTRNKGYIEAGVNQGKGGALRELQQGVALLAARAWVKG